MNKGVQIYLKKYLEDFGKRSTVYTALVEAVTNSIDSINRKRSINPDFGGTINIRITREPKLIGNDVAKIQSIAIEDDGIGFTDENRDSFNTLYSQLKVAEGGKGLGRMFFIKYFDSVDIESTYCCNNDFYTRNFTFGHNYEIIENETNIRNNSPSPIATGAKITLSNYCAKTSFNDDIDRFSHRILEKILNYFASEGYNCPKITVFEDGSEVVLNDLIGKDDSNTIQEKNSGVVTINNEAFNYKSFELSNVYTQKSRIMLTANNKVVTEENLDEYIPEFATDFIKKDNEGKDKRYIVRFYVYANYLDKNVNNERNDFVFGDFEDMMYPIGKKQIEYEIAQRAKELLSSEVSTRFEVKKHQIKNYAEKNIWYRDYVEFIDMEKMKINPSDDDIEQELRRVKYRKDMERKLKVENIVNSLQINSSNLQDNISNLISEITDTDKSNLAEYMAFRRSVLHIFNMALNWNNSDDKKFERERVLHDIIFPTRHDSDDVGYNGHNLWIIDEKLNFTTYISSDKRTFNKSNDRPDIAAFHYPVSYREGTKAYNPVSIFEFKRPGRDDFINASSDEDPIEQIVRYVNEFRDGNLKQPTGQNIDIQDTTPFYGYIIASVNNPVKKWLTTQKDLRALPDNAGWYKTYDNINLRIEFITWEKLLQDAEIRHRIFFERLGIDK